MLLTCSIDPRQQLNNKTKQNEIMRNFKKENAYVSVTLAPLADGNYRIESFSKLRTLAAETERLYYNQGQWVMIDPFGLRVAPAFREYLKPGKIVAPEIISQLDAAGKKLIEIEKKVEEFAAKAAITVYIGGAVPQLTVKRTVLECERPDGSVYSWRVKRRDKSEYAPGDIVEVEFLGHYANEFHRVVAVKEVDGDAHLRECRVVRRVQPVCGGRNRRRNRT